MQAAISDYQPPVITSPLPLNQESNIIKEDIKTPATSKPPKVKVKPTSKEIEELFYQIMLEYTETAVEENQEVVVYFKKSTATLMEAYWNRVPEKIIQKLRERLTPRS